MYANDSFFDLPPWGQVGLAAISGLLFSLTLFSARRLLLNRPVWMCIPGGLLFLWLFIWISPQIYYQYYHLIFDSLPHQWVIWPPPNPVEVFKTLAFLGPQNLSAHGKSLLGWCLLIVPFLGKRARLTD